jgi:hypothetical protein
MDAGPDVPGDSSGIDASGTTGTTADGSGDMTVGSLSDSAANGDGAGVSADAGAGDGGIGDGSARDGGAASGYVYDGSACVRAPDAGWPEAFDAGALPDALALPQVLSVGLFPVLHHPTFISVSGPNEPYASRLDHFLSVVGCSPYWSAVGRDYGVGEAIAGPPVHLSSPPAATMIGSWLAGKIDGNDPQFPRPAPETVYVLWYPADASAEGFPCNRGYFHSWTQLMDGTKIWYAVATHCTDDAGADNDVEALTANSSHELVEVCSDPGNGAYASADPGHAALALLVGTEVADMCVVEPNAYVIPADFPWRIQRSWSNREAWLGHDPCVPVDSTDYFYAAPILADTTMIPVDGVSEPVAAVTIPVGGSKTIDVHLASNVANGRPLQVIAWDARTGGGAHFAFNWLGTDAGITTGNPGDTLQLTIQKQSGNSRAHAEVFGLLTSMAGSTKQVQTFGISGD